MYQIFINFSSLTDITILILKILWTNGSQPLVLCVCLVLNQSVDAVGNSQLQYSLQQKQSFLLSFMPLEKLFGYKDSLRRLNWTDLSLLNCFWITNCINDAQKTAFNQRLKHIDSSIISFEKRFGMDRFHSNVFLPS